MLPRSPQRRAFAPDTTTRDRPAPRPRPPVRRLESRQRAPLDPVRTGRAVVTMTGAPEPVAATRAGRAPAVIHLPDLSRPAPKKPNRQRRHIEHFRTDDAEHIELASRAQAAGLSVNAYSRMQTLGAPGPRARRSPPSERSRLNAQHMAALNRVGNNVNQGVRALNQIALTASEGVSRDRLADEIAQTRGLLETALAALLETLAANRAALGYDREG